jgi:thiosulfate/3-mercaptopyruvate sulfurtransferase
MTVPTDPDARFANYAHPERLVSTEWLAANLGTPGLVVVESDEDVLLYETGHIEGAVKIDWHTDLNDPVERDYVDGEGFAKLLGSKGISRDTTVVIYGDKNNWWAAYALWVFSLFGHEDVRLLDGGRAKWEAEGRRGPPRSLQAGRWRRRSRSCQWIRRRWTSSRSAPRWLLRGPQLPE